MIDTEQAPPPFPGVSVETRTLCDGRVKIRYATQEQATQALADVRAERAHPRRGRTKAAECRTYRCERCQGWHLTSRAHDY